MMIAAIFEVCLKADRKRHYFKIAADLKPLLEKVTMSALPPKADINWCLRHERRDERRGGGKDTTGSGATGTGTTGNRPGVAPCCG